MEKLLQDLEELGVYIPKNLDDAGLLCYAKQANPWVVTTGKQDNGDYYATTRKGQLMVTSTLSEAYAALVLLKEQLIAGKYTTQSVGYKLTALQRNQ